MSSPNDLTATQAAAAIAASSLSCVELTEACLARIAVRDDEVRAFVHLDPEEVRAQARAADEGPARGLLRGLPVAIKDVIDVAGAPTGCNSPIYDGAVAARDAAVVSMLRSAGAVILGKADTVEFALSGAPAATRNPHDLTRTPGGSSAGSAAAVADRMAPLALGTQTGGSISRPASFCGVAALKPSWGLVSLEGVKPVAPSLDTLGWFARAVDDLALMARALRVPGVDERPAPEPGALRIGVFRGPWWARAAGETVAALDGAAARLRAGGAAVEDVAAPEGHAALGEAHAAIIYMEAGRALLAERMRDAEGLGERFTQMVDRAAAHDWRTMTAAYDAAAATRPAFDALAGGYDALLAPATVGAALEGFQDTGDPVFIKVWTLLGVPTVTLPAPVDGLPVGLQLIAPRYADGVLLAAARTVERVLAG